MYKALTNKISDVFSHFSGKQIRLKDVHSALNEIEHAFIEADVSRAAIDQFKSIVTHASSDIDRVAKLDARSHILKIIRDALLSILSHDTPIPDFQQNKLQVIMMVGLQGAGKTTSCGKLSRYIQAQHKNAKVMLCSVDIYRPKAIEQLQIVAEQTDSMFQPHQATTPVKICNQAVTDAKRAGCDVLIIDTAGRLDIDQDRMDEIKQINQAIKPHHTFYTVDSMMGQSALTTAKAFNETVSISGIILTKTDSDTKGGVALSIKSVIEKPILWVGTGEGFSQLEPFDAERIADQLLDMGDIVGLAKKATAHIDQAKSEKISKRLHKGIFTLDDMLAQIEQIHNMGGLSSILKLLPGAAKLPDNMMKIIEDDTKIKTIQSLIQSMTQLERGRPELIRNHKGRQMRVLKGSGRSKTDINELLKGYDKMKKMTEKMKGGKMKALMQQFSESNQMPREE